MENDMERHWNVLKFTCGLMDDSSLLIEKICQAFVEIVTRPNPNESFGSLYGNLYLTDIDREKSARSLSPFNNAQICYNRVGYNTTNPEVHVNYPLFFLNGLDMLSVTEIVFDKYTYVAYKEFSERENLPPCSVVIHQGLILSLGSFLELCSCIRQPIKHLLIFGQEIPCALQCCSTITVQLPRIVRRPKNFSEPQYEPSSPMRNRSEPDRAILSHARGLNSFNGVNFDYLTTVVFHKVDCKYLVRSLNQCKLLTHITYIKCIDPSFHTLGENKDLKELTVENCILGLNTETELYAQLGYLKQLENISFKKMNYEKYLSKYNRVKDFSSLRYLKKLSLRDCELTTRTTSALMKFLVQSPLVDLNLSGNFLLGFIKKLYQTPEVRFPNLERMNCNNCYLLKADTTAFARLISENRLPTIKTVSMKGNDLANDRGALDELKKSCKHFQRRKDYQVQVYIDRRNEIRKRDGNCEVKHGEKRDEMKDSVKKDEVKHSNRLEEVQSKTEKSDRRNEMRNSDGSNEVKRSEKRDKTNESVETNEVKHSDQLDKAQSRKEKIETNASHRCHIL